jgi:hypothetical protein
MKLKHPLTGEKLQWDYYIKGKETFDKIVRGKESTDESDLLVGLFD